MKSEVFTKLPGMVKFTYIIVTLQRDCLEMQYLVTSIETSLAILIEYSISSKKISLDINMEL